MQYSVVNYKTVKENIDFRYEPEFFLPKYIEQEGYRGSPIRRLLSSDKNFPEQKIADFLHYRTK